MHITISLGVRIKLDCMNQRKYCLKKCIMINEMLRYNKHLSDFFILFQDGRFIIWKKLKLQTPKYSHSTVKVTEDWCRN